MALPAQLKAIETLRRDTGDVVLVAADPYALADDVTGRSEHAPEREADDGWREIGAVGAGGQQPAFVKAEREGWKESLGHRSDPNALRGVAEPHGFDGGIVERGERRKSARRLERLEVGVGRGAVRAPVVPTREDGDEARRVRKTRRRLKQQRVDRLLVKHRIGARAERQTDEENGRGDFRLREAAYRVPQVIQHTHDATLHGRGSRIVPASSRTSKSLPY